MSFSSPSIRQYFLFHVSFMTLLTFIWYPLCLSGLHLITTELESKRRRLPAFATQTRQSLVPIPLIPHQGLQVRAVWFRAKAPAACPEEAGTGILNWRAFRAAKAELRPLRPLCPRGPAAPQPGLRGSASDGGG